MTVTIVSLLRKIKFKIFDLWILGLSGNPSPRQVHRKLKGRKAAIQELGLRKVAKRYAQNNDHSKYNALLSFFVPGLNLNKSETKFHGNGGSGSSLNSYRKVKIGGETYFEKVYFNHYPDVENNLWFQHEIYPQIKDEIRTPTIKRVIQGAVITVCYFEFLMLVPIERESVERTLIRFSKILDSSSEKIQLKKTSLHNFTSDFEHFYRFKTGILHASKIIDIESLIDYAKKSRRVLTHGDIQEDNAFSNRVLIDWDVMGFYPIGLEQATIYLVLFLKNQTMDYPSVWLGKHYTENFYIDNQRDFKRNFTFFLFVFLIPWFQNNEFLDLRKTLESEIAACSTDDI